MWFGKIADFESCKELSFENKMAIINFMKSCNLATLENGSYQLDNGGHVNIFEYDTHVSNEIFEIHKQYIDIHCVIDGDEIIEYSKKDTCEVASYNQEKDVCTCKVIEKEKIRLTNQDFCVFLPNEPHNAGISLDTQKHIKKAVFKLLAQLNKLT